ncbi:MAG: DeoR/GlpR family DNA-binding transcription regulator [Chloroflexota bacterium]|nr:DeoR/GlpR family DNA-binding transcription regulator [Chloroflexota bacterium]
MNRPLIPAQRRERIREYLEVFQVVRSVDLCNTLGVSEATIRRDLEWLENEGVLERTHGGAIRSQWMRFEPEYAHRAQIHSEEKRRIGALAATLIEDGDVVFINSGTTTTQLISHICSDVDATVITNNMSAALEIGETGFELILLGGSFQPRSNSVAGRFAIDNLNQVYADKAFIGVDGISLKYGCTMPANAEAEVVHLMLKRTCGPIVMVADHSKWGVVSNFEVATLDQIRRLVTDDGLAPAARAELEARSVEILIASAELG